MPVGMTRLCSPPLATPASNAPDSSSNVSDPSGQLSGRVDDVSTRSSNGLRDENIFISLQIKIDSIRRIVNLPAMGTLYRHGDVLIEEVETLPKNREKLQHTILAHGEVTGHSHRIREFAEADLYQTPKELYLHVRGASVSVVHEEHKPIALAGGYYRVWRQREYSPTEIRVVRD